MIQFLAAFAALSTLLAAPAPVARCAVDDERLIELSGMAVNPVGLWGIVDETPQLEVYQLDPASCAVVATRTDAGIEPVDTEDLARGPDGTLWVGDIGDNDLIRESIAVIEVPAEGPARSHPLTYPDGPHNAEALLIDPEGRPVIITKDVGSASIYRTAAAPTGAGPTPLELVGQLTLPESDSTGGPQGADGARLVNGAAASFDGQVVALRSYTDAWLFRVSGTDVVGALAGQPVRVPLSGEPQGEAIAFQPDGTLLSGSETRGKDAGEIRAVPGAVALATTGTAATAGAPATPSASPQQPAAGWGPAEIGVTVAVVVLLLGLGALVLRRRQR